MSQPFETIPAASVGLQLHRIDRRDRLHACEAVKFPEGRQSVIRALMLAQVSGRVDVGGKIGDHFADVLDEEQSILETVALDAASYRALKTKWMRCKVESSDQ